MYNKKSDDRPSTVHLCRISSPTRSSSRVELLLLLLLLLGRLLRLCQHLYQSPLALLEIFEFAIKFLEFFLLGFD